MGLQYRKWDHCDVVVMVIFQLKVTSFHDCEAFVQAVRLGEMILRLVSLR